MPLQKYFRNYIKNESGAAALEFALIAPVFLFLLLGILEVGSILISQNALDTAVRYSSRYGVTGNGDSKTRTETIQKIAEKYSFGILDTEKMVLKTQKYSDFSSIDGVSGAPSLGEGSDIVFYSIEYDWKILTPLVSWGIRLANNTMVLKATHAVMNEPFDS